MKNKLSELFFSFLAMYLFACGMAAIVFLGILLIPLLILTLFVLMFCEMFRRRKNLPAQVTKQLTATKQEESAIIRSLDPHHPRKRAA